MENHEFKGELQQDQPDIAVSLGETALGESSAAKPHRVTVRKPRRTATAAKETPAESDDETSEASAGAEPDDEFVDEETLREMRSETSGYDSVGAYLRQIGRVPLLNAELEVELSKRIEAGQFAEQIQLFRKADEATREDMYQAIQLATATRIKKSPKSRQQAETDHTYARIADLAAATERLPDSDLKALIDDGAAAKRHMVEANLRLVVSLARRYQRRGLDLEDLIDEGNLGMIRAVEKFDFTKGYKFSTYATWWIRQSMTRALGDKGRTIRIPIHLTEEMNKIQRAGREFEQDNGRAATPDELAELTEIDLPKIRDIMKYIHQEPTSLDNTIGTHEDATLGDFIADTVVAPTDDTALTHDTRKEIDKVLETLDARERIIITMRYGLDDGVPKTLQQISDALHAFDKQEGRTVKEKGLSRERIRQLEAEAMAKLRAPERSEMLQDYLD